MTGRFAPSPTGELHVGNLRTALVAWLIARSAGEDFLVRIEDLDRATSTLEHEAEQLADLAALGLDWDGPVIRQSQRFEHYETAISTLTAAGLTYECYCTRREIRDAAAAPHGPLPDGAYPGTCRELTARERSRRREERPPALRLRTDHPAIAVDELLAGSYRGTVDDVVLRRNDGVPAYNLAVVWDDADQGVTTVVRGDDLLESTPRQIHLQRLLDLPAVRYAHLPLVIGTDGQRLAKRHGAVTLRDLAAQAVTVDDVCAGLAISLGLAEPGERPSPAELVERFDLAVLRDRGREPVIIDELEQHWS